MTNQSGAQITSQSYFAFGEQRGGGSLSTDRQYTGQQKDSSGLYYYNARYYDPTLGQFISPDTIVPDPEQVFDYNRYMYGYGNPVKFSDPSGHIAVCFKGGAGNQGTEAPVEGFLENCQNTLLSSGYDQGKHGAILTLYNGASAIQYADQQIRAAKMANPDEPVFIAGYSWGGAAALDLAHELSGQNFGAVRGPVRSRESIDVDLLFLVDPEEDFRLSGNLVFGDADSRPTRTWVPDNVKYAVNVYAGDAGQQILHTQHVALPFGYSVSVSVYASEWTHANGMNNVRGALNVELSKANIGEDVNHYTIAWMQQTYSIMGSTIRDSLPR